MSRLHRCPVRVHVGPGHSRLSSSHLRTLLPLVFLFGLATASIAKAASEQQCDELKCRSPGYNGGYGCWALEGVPANYLMCDGGYVAVPVENVPHSEVPEYVGTFYYYTCCPPTKDNSTISAVTEPVCTPYYEGVCGDFDKNCIADFPGDPVVCIDEDYKYPHETGYKTLQYRCCKDPAKAIQATETSSEHQCDELMCLFSSKSGRSCWALEVADPTPLAKHPLCSGGYAAVPVENVPRVKKSDGTYYYYTCCPPTTDNTTIPVVTEPFCDPHFDVCGDLGKNCIDHVPVDPIICIDEVYKNPREEVFNTSRYRCCKDPPKAIQATETSSEHQCDELMCSITKLGRNCWSLEGADPTPSAKHPLCSGGYAAVPVENVPRLKKSDGTHYYYTCCPPTTDNTTIPVVTEPFCAPNYKACGDRAGYCFADAPLDPMTCLDEIYKYPHKTGYKVFGKFQSWWNSQYRCCKDPSKSSHSSLFIYEIFRIISGIIGCIFAFTIVAGILSSKITRIHAFNLYVVFDLLGVFVYSLVSIYLGSFTVSQTRPPNACETFSASIRFASYSCLWISAIALKEVLFILLRSKQAVRTPPPTVRKALIQAFSVYFLAGGIALFHMFQDCKGESLDFFLDSPIMYVTSLTVVIILPIIYVIYAAIRVWKQKLLPKTGRSRRLYMYFLRIAIGSTMALPIFALLLISVYKRIVGMHYIAVFAIFFIDSISVYFILKKPDIRQAWKKLLTCRCFTDDISIGRTNSLGSLRWTPSNFFSSRFFVRGEEEGRGTYSGSHGELKEQNNGKEIDMVAISLKNERSGNFGDKYRSDEFVISDEFIES